MSDGYEPTEVPEGFEVLETPESPMDLDIFQQIDHKQERVEIMTKV